MIGNYHPFRFEQILKSVDTRWKRMQDEGRALARERGRSYPADIDAATQEVVNRDYPTMDSSESNYRSECLENLKSSWALLSKTGKNIFNITKLAPLFDRTDVSDVNFSELELGYLSCYFHFGKEAGLHIGDDKIRWIDGVYAVNFKHEAVRPFDGSSLLFVCNNINWEESDNLTAEETLRDLTKMLNVILPEHLSVGESLNLEWFQGDPELVQNETSIKRAVSLVVNSVFYMNSVDADVQSGYDDDAPSGLVDKALKDNVKAARTLERSGFSRVKFFARNFDLAAVGGDFAGNSIDVHWRRGHWRRAKVGEGRRSVRIVWVRPTIVNSHLGDPDRPRIYDVD